MNGDIYLQIDGAAMGSPLGPVLAEIFMVELERSLVPKLSNYIKFWKQFADDMITFANIEAIDHILTVLNVTCKRRRKTCFIARNYHF